VTGLLQTPGALLQGKQPPVCTGQDAGRCGEEKNPLSLSGIRPRPSSRQQNSLYRLSYPGFSLKLILSRDSVTTDGFRIDHRIYWAHWYSAWLHFTFYSYIHYCPQSRLHCCCLAAASNGGRSPFSWVPDRSRPQPPASNSNSSQRLNPSSSLHGPRKKHRSSVAM
jgi:hypothetical protein